MNGPAPVVVALRVLAVVLGAAIIALAVAWWRREPPPVQTVVAASRPDVVETDVVAERVAAELGAAVDDRERDVASLPAAAESAAFATLYGSVRSEDGAPIEGVVWLAQGSTSYGSNGLRPGAPAFAFAGLRPGTYRLTSRFDDQLPFAREVEVKAPLTRLDVVLDPSWRLVVHAVAPGGAPLTEAAAKELPRLQLGDGLGAAALAQPLAKDLLAGLHRNVGLGTFRVAHVFDDKVLPKSAVGVLTLSPEQPVHVALLLGAAVVAQQQVSPGTPEVTFEVRPEDLIGRTATVRLRVVDDAGAPVEGATVSLEGGHDPRAKSAADGRFVAAGVTPGRVRLSVWTPDRGGPPLEVDVAAGADLDLGDVCIRAYHKLEIDFDGFGDGTVYLYLLDGPQRPGVRVDFAFVSSQNGRRGKALLHPGRYAVMVRSSHGVHTRVLDSAAIDGQVLRFPVARGATLRVQSAAHLALPLDLQITNADGVPVHRRAVSGAVDMSLQVPVGSYTAVITSSDGAVTRRQVQVDTDGAVLTLP